MKPETKDKITTIFVFIVAGIVFVLLSVFIFDLLFNL